jgi:dihydrofolate synthase/folylpolyglutamate synthase
LTYQQSLQKLNSLEAFGVKPGLERIRALLASLGHPERELKVIHVAGTNGKGSVCAMLDSILRQAGYRTGLFTSPHLVDLRERFQVQGRPIPQAEFAALFAEVWSAVLALRSRGISPTYFEATTALGLLFFVRRRCQVVVLETGLGGRYDSTNVFGFPLATVVTNISLDHTKLLGRTETEIAWEKAGISKPGVTMITAASGRALPVIRREWVKLQRSRTKSAFVSLKRGKNWDASKPILRWGSGCGQEFRFQSGSFRGKVFLPLLGNHQLENMACAAETCRVLHERGLTISPAAIRRGLKATRWPGRLQVLSQKPLVLLDGAHNPGGAQALAQSLPSLRRGRVGLVFGALKDKDWKGILKPLKGSVEKFFVSAPHDKRALDRREAIRFLKDSGAQAAAYPSLQSALSAARAWAGPQDTLVVSGSLYTVGEVLASLT